MLRKKFLIARNVTKGFIRVKIVFKRTNPGDFMCSCIWRDECSYWRFKNTHIVTTDICITGPRREDNINTRHYYYPCHVIKEI
jgi:hypothetical protein